MSYPQRIAFKVAGYSYSHGWLLFSPGPTRCGGIEDGVAMGHAVCEDPQNHHQYEGDWVIAFESLEAMYLAAKAARASEDGEPAR